MHMIQVIPEKNTCYLENGRSKSQPRRITPAVEAAIRAARKHPQLTARLWKAVEIVETQGALWPLAEADQIPREHRDRIVRAMYQSRSLSDGVSIYTISRIEWKGPGLAAPVPDRRHLYTCNCPDYHGRHVQVVEGQPSCKHIIAVRLSTYMAALAGTLPQPIKTVVVTKPDEDHDPTTRLILDEAARKSRGITRWILRQRIEEQLNAANHQLKQAREVKG